MEKLLNILGHIKNPCGQTKEEKQWQKERWQGVLRDLLAHDEEVQETVKKHDLEKAVKTLGELENQAGKG